ncbi:velvet factor-domain-containing protein [Dioszegia hungarica]|uniref:Velvet factor-domain-containing protein n=1 Tax=Dioszegia hungarica TaxID=4972 RepID=A0AA38HB13_9TREE|nr:velvet factor-domain-containing protein [Dioszegia hungarica]KAI9637778.1 velvet factor-domain-containing protein [Dioszegia hungarica]
MDPSRYNPPRRGADPSPPASASRGAAASSSHLGSGTATPAASTYPSSPSGSSRPPVPPFPSSDRRPITAPSGAGAPPSLGRRSTVSSERGRGGYIPSPLAVRSAHPYWQEDATEAEYPPLAQGHSPSPFGFGVGFATSSSSALVDYPYILALPSAHVSLPVGLVPSQSTPGIERRDSNGHTRRHTFPRHLLHPPPPLPPSLSPSTLVQAVPPTPILSVHSQAVPPAVSAGGRPIYRAQGQPAAPPPADHTTSRTRGFQPDYVRARAEDIPRPVTVIDGVGVGVITAAEDGEGGVAGTIGVNPPPIEGMLMLRMRTAPRGGWPAMQREEGWDWTVELQILQEPSMGVSLGNRDISENMPSLDPPLVVRVRFRRGGQVVPDDLPLVEHRLAHMTLHLGLISGDESGDKVDLVRYFTSDSESSRAGSDPISSPTSSPNSSQRSTTTTGSASSSSDHNQQNLYALVGSTFGIAKRATLGPGGTGTATEGWFFAFRDVRVRPTGVFRLETKLIDVLGPGPSGTSTGITPISIGATTRPFTIFREEDYPGSAADTALTATLTAQGVFGRRRGGEGSSSEGSSDSS